MNPVPRRLRSVEHGFALAIVVMCSSSAQAFDLFVKTPANGGDDTNNGSSWSAAKATVQAALDSFFISNDSDTIRVAAGVYNEKLFFPGRWGVALLGGFPVAGGSYVSDPTTNPTIIDGTGIAGSAAVIRIPPTPSGSPTYGTSKGLVIDGFIIRNGSLDGIKSDATGLTVRRCTVENNSGIGINIYGSLTDFAGATPSYPGPLVEQCVVRNNVGALAGGIMFTAAAGRDGTTNNGGQFGLYDYEGEVVNTLVYGNSGTLGGFGVGGVRIEYADIDITNCTIAFNSGAYDGIFAAGNDALQQATVSVSNCIVWNPGGDDIGVNAGTASFVMDYTDVEDAGDTALGTNNLSQDPLFVDAPGTVGTPGQGGTTGSADYHLTGCSPAVNRGTSTGAPADDLDGTARSDGMPDLGAFEAAGASAADIALDATSHDFENLEAGTTDEHTFTITNDGDCDLVIGTIDEADLAPPFSITDDTCSGQTLAPTIDSCTVTVEFAPTAAGLFSDSFDIPSNDPDESIVTIDLDGAALDCTITADDEVPADSTNHTATAPAGPGTYLWSVTGSGTLDGGQGTRTITYSAGSGTELTLALTVERGALPLDCQKTVTITHGPTATNTGPVCDGEDVQLIGGPDGMASYSWTGPSGFSSTQRSPFVSPAVAGVYTLVVDDGAGGQDDADTTVVVNPLPTCAIAAADVVCPDSTGNVATAPPGLASYGWAVTDGTLTSGAGTDTIEFTAGPAGTVVIDLIVADANGCTKPCSHTATIGATPVCDVDADAAVCADSEGNIATAPAGLASYEWTVTGGSIAEGQSTDTLTYTAGAAGMLTIDLTVTNVDGCPADCYAEVTVDAKPDCAITADATVCQGTTDLTAFVPDAGVGATYAWTVTGGTITDCAGSTGNVASVPDAGAGATYAWTVTGGTITAGQDTNSITYTADAPDAVTVEVTVTNGNGCSATCTTDLLVDETDPSITTCAADDTLLADADCQAVVPDLTGDVVADDNCDNDLTITQDPAAGTTIGLGDTVVTLTATDDAGNVDVCTVTLTVEANGCNTGGGAPAPIPDPTSGSGSADADGDFAQSITDTDGQQLAEIDVRGADPGDTIDYSVDEAGAGGAPAGTTFGFGDGVALGRTLTVEATAMPGTFQVTISMVFTPQELTDAGLTADSIELHVLDESATPPVWVPAGVNVGMSAPRGFRVTPDTSSTPMATSSSGPSAMR